MTKGKHTLRLSLDHGETFLGDELDFFVPFTREEARGPSKNMLVRIAFTVESAQDPTPGGCLPH